MTDSGETRRGRLTRNITAGVIAAVIIGGAAIGAPIIVNASNTAHQEQVAQIAAAKDATTVTRAAGDRDTVLTDSAVQAGVIAEQEAEAKAAAEAAAQAAAAKAAADAAAAQAAQQAQEEAMTDTSNDTSSTGSSSPSASAGLPAGSPVPNIPGTDAPDTTQCASGSASTVNGAPVCD